MSQYPPIQVVDEDDQPIRSASMHEAYEQGLIHRIIHVIVEDERGRILLQKRSDKVATGKNCWDISVGGHVDEGESYEEAAERELREELGLNQEVKLERLSKVFVDDVIDSWRLKRFYTDFRVVVDSNAEFHPEPDEVAELKWFDASSIKQLMTEHPDQVANGLKVCAKYFSDENHEH